MNKEIIFSFKGIEVIIECDVKEKIIDAYNKFLSKIQTDISQLDFIYNGNKINEKQSFDKIASSIDKKRNIINISIEEVNKNNIIIENSLNSKEIVCPQCNENIILKIKDYKLFLSDCKNGHKIDNLFFNEYEKERYISSTKIKCECCQRNANKINNYELYKCLNCKIYLCPSCKSNHFKNHKCINYEEAKYTCEEHNKKYIEYCNKCKQNICKLCISDHNNHDIIYFEDIIKSKINVKKRKIEIKKNLDILNHNIKEINKILNNVKNNLDIYYQLVDTIYDNYSNSNKNYQSLRNIYELEEYNKSIMFDIETINDEEYYNNKLQYILNIYNRMNNKINEINNNEFKKNPKLKFKYVIISNCDSYGINDIFEVYKSYKDKKEYFAIKDKLFEIGIFTLLECKKKISLKGHTNNITTVRYFLNNKNFNEYLISADNDKTVIIWNITNNFETNFRIQTKYKDYIFSCLLVFPKNIIQNYIITSTCNISDNEDESATKVYSLNTCKFIQNMRNTKNKKINYLLSWFNKNDNNYYIIQLGDGIFINGLNNNIYYDLKKKGLNIQQEGNFDSGIIFTKWTKDFLISVSENGRIYIWDLDGNFLFKEIILKNNALLMHITLWNLNYIIVADFNNKSFKIIDLELYKVITEIKCPDDEGMKCIKKVYHPTFGESLLSEDKSGTFKLWTL